MGLDIFFHKRIKKEHNPNEPIRNDENGQPQYEKMKEIAYFRKVNFLMDYFKYEEKCYNDEAEPNCHYVPITYDEIESFVKDCELVKKNKKEAEYYFRPVAGFFWGSTDIDEYYYNDIKTACTTFKRILKKFDPEKEEIFMYAWW